MSFRWLISLKCEFSWASHFWIFIGDIFVNTFTYPYTLTKRDLVMHHTFYFDAPFQLRLHFMRFHQIFFFILICLLKIGERVLTINDLTLTLTNWSRISIKYPKAIKIKKNIVKYRWLIFFSYILTITLCILHKVILIIIHHLSLNSTEIKNPTEYRRTNSISKYFKEILFVSFLEIRQHVMNIGFLVLRSAFHVPQSLLDIMKYIHITSISQI